MSLPRGASGSGRYHTVGVEKHQVSSATALAGLGVSPQQHHLCPHGVLHCMCAALHMCAALQVCLQDLCRNPRGARGGAEGHKRGVNCGDRRRGLGQCWRVKGRARSICVDGRCGEGRPARRGSARMHSCVGFWGLLGLPPAPPGLEAAMRAGLVGSVGRLCGSALCGGHRGDGAALAGRRSRVVCRLLCRKMGGGARGARMRCSEGGRRCWRCGGVPWGRWRRVMRG
jgi:hypothetical protein